MRRKNFRGQIVPESKLCSLAEVSLKQATRATRISVSTLVLLSGTNMQPRRCRGKKRWHGRKKRRPPAPERPRCSRECSAVLSCGGDAFFIVLFRYLDWLPPALASHDVVASFALRH